MIIDSHAHIGMFKDFVMTQEQVLDSMKRYGVDFTLISSTDGAEFDMDLQKIDGGFTMNQLESNKKVIDLALKNTGKIGALLWCRLYSQTCDKEFEMLIQVNRNVIYGLKIHPFHTKTPFDSEKTVPYIKMAQKYELPIVVHTGMDDYSGPERVYSQALKYPQVNFVMVHMGLGSDNRESIEYIKKLPNLYGDTTWVHPDSVVKAVKECGMEKILFGTDNPISGEHTLSHEFYKGFLSGDTNGLTMEEYENLMWKNANKLFRVY